MSSQPLNALYLYTDLENNTDQTDIFIIYNRILPAVSKWMEGIFSGKSFEADIHSAYNNTELLRYFYVENKNRTRAFGEQILGFSFPYVFFINSEEKKIAAPLFTWYLNIKPHPSRAESWRISYDATILPVQNAILVDYLREDKQIDIAPELTKYLKTTTEFQKALLDCTFDVSKKLDIACSALTERVREFPTKNNFDIVAQRGDTLWCGTLGFFPHIPSLKKPKADVPIKQAHPLDTNSIHEYGYFEKDVTQYAAFRTALHNSLSVIEGAYNTGKKYILTDIIVNALSQKQKVMVVCTNVQELILIQNELVELGLGHLTFLMKDIFTDKELFLSSLRDVSKKKKAITATDEFSFSLKQWRRALSQVDQQQDVLTQIVYNSETVSDVVGRLSLSERAGNKSILSALKPSDYEFSENTRVRIQSMLSKTQNLFPAVGSLKHPLTTLHPDVFIQRDVEDAQRFCVENLNGFIHDFKDFQHRALTFFTHCSEQITTFYEKKARVVGEQLRRFKEAYSDFSFQYGSDLETNNILRLSGLHAAALFSTKTKAVLEARAQLANSYTTLQSFFETDPIFQHNFLKGNDKTDPSKITANVESFELKLKSWRKQLPNLVQDAMQRLNTSSSKSLHDITLTEGVSALEKDLDVVIEKFNATNLYEKPLVNNRLTLTKKIQLAGEIVEQLEETQLNMRDFAVFYDWQKFWLGLTAEDKNIVETLIKLKPDNWEKVFDAWFYHNILLQNHNAPERSVTEAQAQLIMLDQNLNNSVLKYINNAWLNFTVEQLKTLRNTNRNLFDQFFATSKSAPNLNLLNLNTEHVEVITHVIPVILCTPCVATFFTHNETPVFDRILFYNSNTINHALGANILRGGVSATLFNEYADNQGLAVNSFSAYARTLHAPVVKLGYLHQPQSLVTELNEKVFYKNLKSSPLSQKLKQTFIWLDVNIKSAQQRLRIINTQEIEVVIDLLRNFELDLTKTTTKIGILCFSKPQRDALLSNILQIIQKTERGWERFEHLNRTGLWVGVLSEMAGQKFDKLMVSNTFTDVDSPNLSLSDWRLILNSFTEKLYWINSIPLNILRDEARTNDGSISVLYAQMATWIYDTAQNDTVQAAITLSNLSFKHGIKQTLTSSIWVEVLAEFLENQYGKKRIQKNYVIDASTTVLLAILPDDDIKPLCVLQIDGTFSTLNRFHNFAWEQKILYKIRQRQIQTVSVSSYNWWKNERATQQKLVADIETHYDTAKNALYKKSQVVLKT